MGEDEDFGAIWVRPLPGWTTSPTPYMAAIVADAFPTAEAEAGQHPNPKG